MIMNVYYTKLFNVVYFFKCFLTEITLHACCVETTSQPYKYNEIHLSCLGLLHIFLYLYKTWNLFMQISGFFFLPVVNIVRPISFVH